MKPSLLLTHLKPWLETMVLSSRDIKVTMEAHSPAKISRPVLLKINSSLNLHLREAITSMARQKGMSERSWQWRGPCSFMQQFTGQTNRIPVCGALLSNMQCGSSITFLIHPLDSVPTISGAKPSFLSTNSLIFMCLDARFMFCKRN